MNLQCFPLGRGGPVWKAKNAAPSPGVIGLIIVQYAIVLSTHTHNMFSIEASRRCELATSASSCGTLVEVAFAPSALARVVLSESVLER